MLTKDLLRVSRAGGGYHPQFAGEDDRDLAARVLGTYQGHVGQPRERLRESLTDLERDAEDFKLVRGFAKLIEREATFETRAPLDPARAREESLYADLDDRQVLTSVDPPWGPDELVARYNLSLVQTALFDATEVRIRSSDPRTLVTATKRLGLMYEVEKDGGDWEVVVTGPDALFESTRRYGTRFARLLRTVARASAWRLTATVDDRGTERTMRLSDEDPVEVPGSEAGPAFDSEVEADFATRFDSLDLDWELVREPEPLVVGSSVMIPDFAFDYRFADFRVFFEIMGFWTPEYVGKKLGQLDAVADVEMLVAVDESLGVSEEIEARDHRAITYGGTVRLKDVRDALRRYEDRLVAETVAELPDELRPERDVVPLAELADERGVSESALEDASFPEHELVGRTLVRPSVLAELDATLESGLSIEEVETRLAAHGISETSAALSRLGYRVEWEGLGGGTLRRKEGE
ncbi:hypothetical protein BRC83_05665 [Halobacteriales archaeon QS_1_68_17]|nr:MAG: hypothetical protein BRC83_05665 [Halobacteriales archaeon QS_1_68_17]